MHIKANWKEQLLLLLNQGDIDGLQERIQSLRKEGHDYDAYWDQAAHLAEHFELRELEEFLRGD